MRQVTYNSQRNNKSVFAGAGKFSAWNQCFTSCAVMLMSYYCEDIKGDDDDFLARYLFDIEDSLNKNGLGAEVAEHNHLTGNSSYYFIVQAEGITQYLKNHGCDGEAFFKVIRIDDLPALVQSGPVIVGTDKLGGLPGGHMILLCDVQDEGKSFIVNDPFGNAYSKYVDTDGDGILYKFDDFKNKLKPGNGKCNVLFWVPA